VDNSNILLDRQNGLQRSMPMSFAEELLINSKVRTVREALKKKIAATINT